MMAVNAPDNIEPWWGWVVLCGIWIIWVLTLVYLIYEWS